jgi:hypothetical protein
MLLPNQKSHRLLGAARSHPKRPRNAALVNLVAILDEALAVWSGYNDAVTPLNHSRFACTNVHHRHPNHTPEQRNNQDTAVDGDGSLPDDDQSNNDAEPSTRQ